MSERHADLFATVVPVIGPMAETAATGALRERHARALGELARAWDADVARIALSSVEMFVEEPGPVGPDLRHELLDLLGQYGVAEMLDRLHAGVKPHAAALTEAVRDLSGIDELQYRQLKSSLGRRADVLKAASALKDLIDGARRAGDRSLHNAAQQMFDKQVMFPLQVIEMTHLLAAKHVSPPTQLREEARLIVDFWLSPESGPRPRASRVEAARAARDWRDWRLGAVDGPGRPQGGPGDGARLAARSQRSSGDLPRRSRVATEQPQKNALAGGADRTGWGVPSDDLRSRYHTAARGQSLARPPGGIWPGFTGFWSGTATPATSTSTRSNTPGAAFIWSATYARSTAPTLRISPGLRRW